MNVRKLLACAAALALPLAATALPAQAHPSNDATYREPQVAWVKNAKASGDHATVLAKYRCWGGNEGTHLWVSLKQGATINGYTAEQLSQMEGTSALATSWYDTNVVDPALVTLTCNGTWQVHRYTVAREPGKDALVKGKAFLQFCLFDSRATDDLSHGFAYDYTFIKVHAKHKHHA